MKLSVRRFFPTLLVLPIFLSLSFCQGETSKSELDEWLAKVPNPRQSSKSWVSDPSQILGTTDSINQLISDLESSTSAEIAVVVLPSIGKVVPKDFAVALFNHWGIGKKGKDNGILVLHILDQRRIEIETGYGMEGDLPDATVKRIIDQYAIPAFKADDFSKGHLDLIQALINKIQDPSLPVEKLLVEPSEAIVTSFEELQSSDSPADIESSESVPREFTMDYQGKNYSQLTESEKMNLQLAIRRSEADRSFSLTVTEKKLAEDYYKELNSKEIRNWLVLHTVIAVLLMAGLSGAWIWFQSQIKSKKNPYDQYKIFLSKFGFFYYGAFLIPVFAITLIVNGFFPDSIPPFYIFPPFILGFAFVIWSENSSSTYRRTAVLSRRLKVFRDAPRACKTCKSTMQKLSERDDDAYLEKGQVMEEYLNSIDYDVFVCPNKHSLILKYANIDPDYIDNGTSFLKIDKCPKCKFMTYQVQQSEIVKEADYNSSGSVKVDRVCKHCGHKGTEYETIPRLERSSSSSSGGSSSSSGSFGGGSSGGGGSGSSY